MLRGFIVLVAVLLLSVAWAVSTARYTVQRGDTIYSLAKRFQTTPEVLLKLNNLSRPDLRVGQVLEVPQRTHTVVKGETLYGIARKYGVSLEAVRGANGLSGDAVKLGQVLVIPWESTATSQPIAAKPTAPKPDSGPPATTGSSSGKPSSAPTAPTRPPPAPPPSPASPTSSQPVSDAPDPNALPQLPTRFPRHDRADTSDADAADRANSARGIPPPPVPTASLPSFGEAITTQAVSSSPDNPALIHPALIHTVQPGETLFGIARKYGVTVEDIKSLNQISKRRDQRWSNLHIPVASVPRRVTTRSGLESAQHR
ncbi:MAG: LysM peptidoglycan-binding domain-containing protein, partial [Pleurocapsa sp. SU_196_0]|nr:LysM peptidoglycan-binding domain-containing protein [Pleurocapsa sp. SU_196_0]